MIADGTIGPDALDGPGRSAKIIVDRAIEQIKLRRDVGQSLGNGLGTQLFERPSQPSPRDDAPPHRSDDVAYQIQKERLESERRKNRQAAIDEQVQNGRLVPSDDVRAEMTRLARQVDDENAAMLADYATAIAGQFAVPQRDVLHLLREVRAEKKAIAAKRATAIIETIPETVETVIEQDDRT